MSYYYVKAVLDALPALTSATDVLVLVAIAEQTSDETRLAWPSIATLSRRVRKSDRTVQRALRRLESHGLVSTTTGGYFDGEHRASCYRLEFDHRGQALTYKEPPKRPARRVNSPVPASTAVTHLGPRTEPRSDPKAVPNPPSARQLVDGVTLAQSMLIAGGQIPYTDADIIKHAHITAEQLAALRRSRT